MRSTIFEACLNGTRYTASTDTIRDDGNAGFISWIDPYNGAFSTPVS